MLADDLSIARAARLRPLDEVGRDMGLRAHDLEPYGDAKAKVRLDVLDQAEIRPSAKYVVVTAVSPTVLGEGKTVHTVGIAQALNRIGRRAGCVVRQPSMGPVFGIKGGGSGGGHCQIVPPDDVNLHLTGDFHAVTAAHNLCAAFLDAHLFHGNELGIDLEQITWQRVLDLNDRALRCVEVGHDGTPRRTGFEVTAASEIMAILGVARNLHDLRRRLGAMVVGHARDGQPVSAEELQVVGAMTAILKDAIKPTLMQTLEGTPALVHTGPVANIAPGNSSIVADQIALRCLDFVVTEAGFGADMGAEKFFDIKCRTSGLRPHAALLVATVRALKIQSGRFATVAGRALPLGLQHEDLDALGAGMGNLVKQIENVRIFGIPVVVAINRFPTDSEAEIEMIREAALAAGASDAHVSTVFDEGGRGGEVLAHALVKACDEPSSFRFLYPSEAPLKQKIEMLATKIYGAQGVDYEPEAERQLARFEERGYGAFPICMAKTQYSLSHDPELKGRPTDYRFGVRDARVAVGAGYVYPLAGTITTMPGLGKNPRGANIDLDRDGDIVGL